jgi:hypothetical protein
MSSPEAGDCRAALLATVWREFPIFPSQSGLVWIIAVNNDVSSVQCPEPMRVGHLAAVAAEQTQEVLQGQFLGPRNCSASRIDTVCNA